MSARETHQPCCEELARVTKERDDARAQLARLRQQIAEHPQSEDDCWCFECECDCHEYGEGGYDGDDHPEDECQCHHCGCGCHS